MLVGFIFSFVLDFMGGVCEYKGYINLVFIFKDIIVKLVCECVFCGLGLCIVVF